MKRFFYAADDGGGGGEPSAASAEPTPEGAAEDPWKGFWGSQLTSEFREKNKDALLALKGKSLTEVIGEHFESKGKLDRAILPPGRDAKPEEVKAFLKRMNIPETPDEYDFNAETAKAMDPEGKFVKDFKETAHKAGLTKKQATAMFDKIVGYTTIAKTQSNEKKATFDARLLEAVGKDEGKAKETKALTLRFLAGFKDKELAKLLSDSGVLYEPRFVMSMAEYHRQHGLDAPFIDGSRPSKEKGKEGKGMGYGDEFKAHYGERK